MHFNFRDTLNNFKAKKALFSMVFLICGFSAFAQTNPSNSLGNTFIHAEGNMTAFGDHSFDNAAASGGNAGTMPGLIGGERVPTKGYFNFAPGSKWVEAQDFKYIDGYVRYFGNTKFLFPIGDNYMFRPCGISGGSYAEACYYGVDPTSAITDDLRGGDFPVLPGTGPFPSANADDKVIQVSEYEYWDINGTDPTIITLTWDDASEVDLITNNDLERLTIVGWNGAEWEAIPSKVDVQTVSQTNNNMAFNGAIPDLTNGSLSTTVSVVPSDFEVYTLASSCINMPLEAPRNITACAGEELTLNAESYDEATLTWSTGQTGTSVVVTPQAATTYTVTAKLEGCELKKDIQVDVSEVFVDVVQDTFICRGQPLTLGASGTSGGFYQWDTGNNMVFGDSVTININAPQDIYVTITNDFDCTDVDVVSVTVRDAPDVSTGRDAATCLGDSVIIQATGSESGYGYEWSTGDTLQFFNVSPAVTTTYSVSLTENGCTDVSFTTVEVHPMAFVEIMSDSIYCGSDPITIETDGTDGFYRWSTGENAESITVTPAPGDTYGVTVTSNGDCYWEDEITFTSYEEQIELPEDINICPGQEINIAAEGLFDNVTWSNGSTESSINVEPTESTTYDITAFYNGCEVTKSVDVSVGDNLDVDLGPDITVCKGETVTLSTSAAGQYYWSNAQNTSSITVTPFITTTYSVRVTSGDCVATDEITINIEDDPAFVQIITDPVFCPGEALVLETDGTEGTYIWEHGPFKENVTVNPQDGDVYSVTVTNAAGCSWSDEITLEALSSESLDLGEDLEICIGEELTLEVFGTYDEILWDNGADDNQITVSPIATTTYSVTAKSGICTISDEIVVSVVQDISLDLGEDQFICAGDEVELSDLSVSGDFEWSSGENSQIVNVSPFNTTTYIATVTSGSCSSTDEVTINVENVFAEIEADTIYCEGDQVTMTANVSAGDVEWSTGVTNNSITITPDPLATYSLTVTSDNGCTAMDEISFSPFDDNYLSLGDNKEICAGQAVTLEVDGIFDSVTWEDGTGAATRIVTPTSTTTYSVTASYEGCESTAEVTITVGTQLSFTLGNDITICPGEEVELSGDVAGNYSWSTGETSETITVSPNTTTTYIANVTSGSCDAQDEIRVIVEDAPFVEIQGNNIVCNGEEVRLTASGTSGNYLWSTGETTASITLTPFNNETHSVTVTTPNGCTASTEITFQSFEDNYLDLGEDINICIGEQVTLELNGVYDEVTWSNGETTSAINVTPDETTTYTVNVKYGDCEASDEITIEILEQLDFDLGNDITVCAGQEVELSGNVAGQYSWSNGDGAPVITVSPTETTTYVATVTSGDCEATDEITVQIENMASVQITSDSLFCPGAQVVLEASGSAGTYEWSNGETGSSIIVTPSNGQSYTVTVTSVTGCSSSDEITMQAIDNQAISLGEDKNICGGQSVTLELEGDFDSYAWSSGQSSPTITVSPQTTTTYTVTATIGSCSAEAEVTIFVSSDLQLDLGQNVTICPGEAVTLSGNAVGNYTWSNGETTESIVVNPTSTTTYTAQVNSGNCSDEAEVTITVENVFANIQGESVICEGAQAELNVDGPAGAQYNWSTGANGPSLSFNPTANVEYRVTVTSASGCEAVDAITFELYDDAAIDIGQDLTICAGESVDLNVTGTYDVIEWEHGAMGPNVSVSPTTTTTYVCNAIYGSCFTKEEITINVVDDLDVDLGEDIVICPGQEVTLSDLTVFGSFDWSTGDNTAVINVSPGATTNYSVTVSSGNCTDEDQVTVTVQNDCTVDLYLDKTVDNFEPNVGDQVKFSVIVGNASSTVAATNVEVSEEIKSGFSFVSYTASAGYYDVNTGKWYINSVAPGEEVVLEIIAEVLSTGDYSNIALITDVDQEDPDSDPVTDDEDEDDTDVITLDVKNSGNGQDNMSEIGDRVWIDTNGNGIQDQGEQGMGGLEVSLYQSSNLNTPMQTMDTDQDGKFLFTGLSSGNYFLEFEIPDGYVITTPAANGGMLGSMDSDVENTFGPGTTNIIALGPNESLRACDAGFYAGGSIGDFVWFDAIGGLGARYDENIDSGESGIEMLLRDFATDTIIAQTFTDALGFYSFDNLPKGDYIVEIVLNPLDKKVLVFENAADDDIDSDFETGTGRTPIIALGTSQHIDNIDAGLEAGTVPVVLNEFWGERIYQEKLNRLFWSTESEVNSDYFIIERSLNGRDNFEPVDEVDAAGASQSTLYYTWDDLDSRGAALYYYRLIMVDYDGSETYSKIIVIEVTEDAEEEIVYKVYPIPTRDFITLEMTTFQVEEFHGFLVNNLGQNVRKIEKRDLDNGLNSVELNVSDLSEGTYYLNFYIGDKQYISRILVIKS